MRSPNKILLTIICAMAFISAEAQSGGPPMLTDDPGTVELHKWEINTSFNSQVTKDVQLAIPYIDVNYGVAANLQLKIEDPYLITTDDNRHASGKTGDPLLGVKYHIIGEDKHFVSVGIYPQFTITGHQKGFLLPLLFEKTFGKFLIGEDIGYFFIENDSNNVQSGSLLGYRVSNRFEIMGEYFTEISYSPSKATVGYMNYGFRYGINKLFTLLGSFGTQVVTPIGQQKQYFFSYLGIQSSF